MPTMTFAEALIDGLCEALQHDEAVTMIGSALLGIGPARRLVDRITQEFPDRLVDGPIAEAAIAGLAAGAAMAGSRPFVDLGTASFSLLAWSQITNEAAVAHLMSGGQIKAPVVYHMLHGVRGGGAAQHSSSPQSMLWNCPGLQIVLPASPRDVKGLVRRALKSDNPTVILNHAKLMAMQGEVPAGDYEIEFGRADVKRTGRDVTVVATSYMVQEALKAADVLAGDGIDAEVVDLRTLVPFDQAAVLESVAKTGRLLVVDECPLRCGVASEVVASVAEHGMSYLKQPPRRLARADAPVACSPGLEAAITPDAAKIAQLAHAMMQARA
ncbi:2-oxoisovalerate dehydrogenase subunit beta [Pigmentiphaga humi]|uniref:2-oxoisovalerate dehydrogenase subunit beta n=1 Tax=Pigmentiphaga humi TaxID=2478468 RepID=A0A3P4B1A7_9BURK|nr:transketolase C-terminal domain-containing protein [Pigmentiphaga humi]VCU69356.1 2-oxoisovalerate dehydrogenase subunit beta [Pigmentiphaga humi]